MSGVEASGPPSYRIRIAGSTDGGDRVPDLSPREAFERWLNKLRVDKSEATVSSYHYRLKLFIEWCEEQHIAEIGELTGWDIESFETHRRQQGIEPITLNKEMLTLQLFLEYCARVELVDETLPGKVDPPDVDKQADVDETRLHSDRAEALFEYYDTHDRGSRAHALLTLCWYTGARLNALRGLDLDHYHSREQYVEFLHQPDRGLPLKNGRDGERAVGLPDYATDVLDEYVRNHRKDVFDDGGSRPLLTSQSGRASENAVRSWMYLATVPCLHTECPHGNDPETCEFLDYSKSSQCPSSRSPHQVRTGTITWQLNRGVPIEVVANRVNTSVRVLKKHYDQPTRLEELEERRRQHLDRLSFDESGGGQE
jgi:site-specific recombinase XerD